MKALSIQQPWANMIVAGTKTIETRTWETKYRGDLLIVSSKKPNIRPAGYALAIVTLKDCRKMVIDDEFLACCECYQGAYAWCLADTRPLKNIFPVKGKLGLYDVDIVQLTQLLTKKGSQIEFPF